MTTFHWVAMHLRLHQFGCANHQQSLKKTIGMAGFETEKNPPFRHGVRASGLGEVWTHTKDDYKFSQFGWRCSTKESSFCNTTLIGNWNEDRFILKTCLKEKPLPSQFAHYFNTTMKTDYNLPPVGVDDPSKRHKLKRIAGTEPAAFPGHQPELDTEDQKAFYNSFITTSKMAYIDPKLRKEPLVSDASRSGSD